MEKFIRLKHINSIPLVHKSILIVQVFFLKSREKIG